LVNKKINSQKKSENLHDELKILHKRLRQDTKKKWDRVLPFEEMLFDRWEKAKFLKAKNGSSVYSNCYVYGKVTIGKNTWIGPHTLLDGSGGKITIGDYCSISNGVQIYTHHTVKWALTRGKANYEKKSVSIGDCCYFGPNAIISMGSKIGKCCIIGANTLVNSKIPDNSIVYGTPGRIVGKVKVKGKNVSLEYFKK
jgi:acetyltransferase-like isoleucine patch superfamily enzyme